MSSWPEDLKTSLWVTPLMAERSSNTLPLMGIDFKSGFLWAFLFGCALVFTVGWRNLRTGDAYSVSSGYKIINDLKIGDLGGENALTRACLLYAGSLVVIYIILTFFGKIIFEGINAVSQVGVRIELSEYQFDSPQWPLLIAFGFAGVAPMLPPVQTAEAWLRKRTYRAVGIPIRIEQSTRKILEVLHRHSRLAEEINVKNCELKESDPRYALAMRLATSQKEFAAKLKGTWLEHALTMREVRWRQVLRTYAELDLMIDWAKDVRGAWPGAEVPESLRVKERELVRECEERLDELLTRINAYSTYAETKSEGAQTAAVGIGVTGGKTSANTASTSGATRSQNSPPPSDDERSQDGTADKPHRLNWLKKVIGQMVTDRDNLVAILAIYAEKDSDIGRQEELDKPRSGDQLNEPMLRWLLKESVSESAGKGPDLEVFVALLPAFLTYGLLMANGWHEIGARGADQTQPVVVLVSAGIETLRLAALVSFPVAVAFAFRQSRLDAGEWVGISPSQNKLYLRQLSQAGLVAVAVAFLALFGVAVISAFVAADSPARFRELLTSTEIDFVLYYLTLAPLALVIAVSGLVGADLRRRKQSEAVLVGLIAAILVFGYEILHLTYYYGEYFFCPAGGGGFRWSDLRARECFLHYNWMDMLIYPILAFLVTSVFGQPVPAEFRARFAGSVRSTVGIMLIFGCAWSISASSLSAQNLTIGFRADAEPFSYLPAATENAGDPGPYRGYLANLCYTVFEAEYNVISVGVTLENRFDLLRSASPKIDVLCDPVTLRLNDSKRLKGTLFSPIVFASGVTYLEKAPRRAMPVLIAYGENSTAARLASEFCRNDIAFVVRREDQSSLTQFCNTAEALLYFSIEGQAPAFCRAARKENPIDCLATAVKAELNMASEKLRIRESSGYIPLGLRRQMQKRIEAWEHIEDSLKTLDRNLKNSDPKYKIIINELGGSCGDTIETKEGIDPPYRFCPKESHNDIIEWFCNPEMAAHHDLIYLGDREIILAKHRSYEQTVQPCLIKSEGSAPDLSYEPYVILVREDRSDILQFLQRRIHELFSDSQWAKANYEAAFGTRPMSLPLAYLFLLNGVEPDRWLVNTDPLADDG